MDGMNPTKVFSFMDSTEFFLMNGAVDMLQFSFQRKMACAHRPPCFHWKMEMRRQVAKTSKKECRIEDVIGMYSEYGLSCSG